MTDRRLHRQSLCIVSIVLSAVQAMSSVPAAVLLAASAMLMA